MTYRECGSDIPLKVNESQSKMEIFITWAFIYLSFGYLIEYYSTHSGLFLAFNYFTQLLSILVCLLLLLTSKIKVSTYRILFILNISILLIISLNDMLLNISASVYEIAIYIQIVSAFCFAKYELEFWTGFFVKLSVLSLIAMIYIFIGIGINISMSFNMLYGWTETFFYATLFWGVIPFVIISVLTGKHIILSFTYWVCAVVLNLVIQKRFIIIDSLLLALVIILILIIQGKRTTRLFKIFVTISAVVVIMMFVWGDSILLIFNSVFNRILVTAKDMSNFDRWVETKNYFQNEDQWKIILGQGVLGSHIGLGKISYALHMGWSNFIMKGGIILLALILFGYFRTPFLLKRMKYIPLKMQFSFWIILIYFVRLFYLNLHSASPEMLLFFYCLFNVMDYKLTEKNEISK